MSALFPVWLLRSKVSPTRQRVDLLERPSLTLKLHRSLDATLSLIHAPAGYGKSTLLSDWRRILIEEGHTVCWLSLGKQDNDATHLLTYIAFALAEGGVKFDTAGAGLDYQFSDLSEREFLSLIIHFIAEHGRRVALILDDFENLGAEMVDRVIQPFLAYVPDNLHISIATRDDSRLHISNLEAKGQAVRFGASQLRFTPMELNDFLAGELSGGAIQKLFKVTEGWPVAIQMIRSAVQVEGDIDRITGHLGRDAANITAYLSEQVLGNLDPVLRDFLMDISLVDRIDCEFADYLREQEDSHARFSQARVLDTLVLPVDSVDATYRLHPLFREHLYERLSTSRPARSRALHLRAADWYSEKGDLVEAVRHCVLAGAPEHSIGIVERVGGVMIWFKEGLTRLRAIMRLLDQQTAHGDWRLALIECLLFIKDGRVHQARQLFDSMTAKNTDEVRRITELGENAPIHEFVVMEIVISIYEGKPISQALCVQLEAKAASIDEREHAVLSNLFTFLCVGYLQRGELRAARRFGEMAISAFTASGSSYGVTYIHFHFGDISFAEGNSVEAARSYQQGLESAKKHFNDDEGMKLVANILISELNYELGDTQGMPPIARSIPRLLERHEAWFDIYAAGYTTSAHREFDEFGVDAALAIVDRAVEYAELNRLFRLTRLLACVRIELLLRAGSVASAREVLEQSGIHIEDYLSATEHLIAWRERDAAVVAITRLLIREGKHAEALSWLLQFAEQARDDGHVRVRMNYQILLAIAHDGLGDAAGRDEHLGAALELSARSRYVRPFLDHREELEQGLRQYLTGLQPGDSERLPAQHATEILKGFGQAPVDDGQEPLLSPRENEVLEKLVQGHSNKVIARSIGVSESTVRFHLRNIFVKLNVNSRLQAVTVARQQHLI